MLLDNKQIIKHLHGRLKPVQQEMFELFLGHEGGRKYVIHCSRRLGKTYLLCVLAVVFAVSKSNAQIRYASVTQKSVRKMIHPIMKELFSGLPKDYQGKWNSQEGAYVFDNGSMIHVAGVNNNHADDLRGTAADLCLVDEAAFVDELEYLVDSVLIPQLITTEGKLIMASSSPLSPAHQFADYIHEARNGGFYSSFDIDQGGYTEEVVEEFLKEAGGRTSTTARREYFNELIVDDKLSIIPEWDDQYVIEPIHDEFYKYYHRYEAMDIGVRDKTAILFGYYDFKNAKLIIEDEFTISGADTTTKNINDAIVKIEKDLKYSAIYRGIADNNNLLLLNDLSIDYGKHFSPTNKESLAAMVNELRLWVQAGRIQIHPKCEQLIGCLKYGVYQDVKRNEFGRSKNYGHYDALAALIYLVRNIDQHTNPIPIDYGVTQNTWMPNKQNQASTQIQEMKKIFNL